MAVLVVCDDACGDLGSRPDLWVEHVWMAGTYPGIVDDVWRQCTLQDSRDVFSDTESTDEYYPTQLASSWRANKDDMSCIFTWL